MNAQQILVSRLSGDRMVTLAGAPLDLNLGVVNAHTRTLPSAPRDLMADTSGRGIGSSDVRDLLDAAGPLSLRDIAGGLDVSTREAAAVVHYMIEHDRLNQDEWERYRLPSAYRG